MKRLPLGLQEVSKLFSLRKLQLVQSKMSLDMSLVEELQLLEHLQVLNISIKSSLVVEKLLYAPRSSRSNNKPGESAMSVNIIPFQKLESLRLHNLATLKNIYWEPLPFPCLKTIHVTECPESRKLPLDSQSVSRVEEFVIKYKEEEWFERVEWDDEATRLRFLPFLKFFGPEWQVTYVL
ncbi:BnaC08g41700D [Brassica napus]|uniref:BnaC08g41700D protein n=1 Tax=Brassica napus TaxID=3708 RepID=A0A078HA78_BRANA|nr:BnaC08g41700D [Brassica napus]